MVTNTNHFDVAYNNSGNYYGTSVDAVASVQKKGLICVLDIDAQGVRNVKKSSLDPHYLFIAPPSMKELEKRLRTRHGEGGIDPKTIG